MQVRGTMWFLSNDGLPIHEEPSIPDRENYLANPVNPAETYW